MKFLNAVVVATALLLSSCGRNDDPGAFCRDLWTRQEASKYSHDQVPGSNPVAARMATADNVAGWCVARAAYVFARSGDPADVVAKAATYTCEREINEAASATYTWEQKDLGGPGSKLLLPSRDESQQRVVDDFGRQALVATVEARAGRCWLKVKS